MSRFDVNRNRFDAIDDGADLSNLIEPILALLGVLLIFVVVGMTVPTLTTVASELAETNGDDLEGDVEDAIVYQPDSRRWPPPQRHESRHR